MNKLLYIVIGSAFVIGTVIVYHNHAVSSAFEKGAKLARDKALAEYTSIALKQAEEANKRALQLSEYQSRIEVIRNDRNRQIRAYQKIIDRSNSNHKCFTPTILRSVNSILAANHEAMRKASDSNSVPNPPENDGSKRDRGSEYAKLVIQQLY